MFFKSLDHLDHGTLHVLACLALFVFSLLRGIMTDNATDFKKAYFERIAKKIEEISAIGSCLIRGIDPVNNDEEDDAEEGKVQSGKEEKPLSKEQVILFATF